MKKNFFYQERGKTAGPVTIEEMKARVRDGRVQLFDMVHLEGEPGWKMAMEFHELRDEFKSGKLQALSDRPWVILQRRTETHLDFATSGPFTTEEIRKSIQAGTISYGDYVWKEGFHEWTRIGTVEEFNRRLQTRAEEIKKAEALPPLPEMPVQKILQNVTEMKRAKPIVEPPPPPEAAGGKDLTREKEPLEPVTPPIPPPQARPPATPAIVKTAPVEETTVTNIQVAEVKSRKLVDVGIVAFLVVVLAAAALLITRFMDHSPKPVIEKPPPVAEVPPPKPEVKPTLPEPKPQPAVPDTPPTELVLKVQTLSSTQVKIEIRSDAGPSYPIFVQIVGLPGHVAEGASFYRYLKFKPSGDRDTPIDLSDVKLPQGKFILRVQSGNLNKEAKMSIGTNETQFKQAVGRLRKTYAAAIWKERLALFALAQTLEKQITEAAGGKPFNSKVLRALNGVKKSTGANYILFDQWYELKDIMDEAKTGASAALLARAKQAKERISTFTVWK
jgi:hypothetical protein